MKQILIVFLAIILGVPLVSCSNESSAEKQSYTGYIALEGNVLTIDDFEFIKSEDEDRVKELGLTIEDMPNGYYIQNIYPRI